VSNPCRFCGATDQLTKEHIWPVWLRDYLPPFDEDDDIERWSPATRRQRWRQPFLTTTVKAFYDDCNNGWMAALEAAAKPIVGPMVIGQAMDLDGDAQQIVANWVALKGLDAQLLVVAVVRFRPVGVVVNGLEGLRETGVLNQLVPVQDEVAVRAAEVLGWDGHYRSDSKRTFLLVAFIVVSHVAGIPALKGSRYPACRACFAHVVAKLG